MTGIAKQIEICGTTASLGDYMEVQYTSGHEMCGGIIKGTVTELWSPELSNGHLQGRLSCGWCFHDNDRVLVHRPNASGETRLGE